MINDLKHDLPAKVYYHGNKRYWGIQDASKFYVLMRLKDKPVSSMTTETKLWSTL